jgi:hypothetical protein
MASVLATQVILERVYALGLPITLRDRIGATIHDLLGMLDTYLPLIAVAFLVAMPVAWWLGRYLRRGRFVVYGLAGATAVLAIHLSIKAVLGLNGIAAVRDSHGLALQALAGFLGGYLFFVFTGQAHRRSPSHAAPPHV